MEFDDPKISDHYGWKRFQLFNELAVDVVENFQIVSRECKQVAILFCKV
jgi:hypothetical protein